MFFVKGEGTQCGTDIGGVVDELEGAEDIVSIAAHYLGLLSSIFKALFKPTRRLYTNLVHLDSRNK